MNDFTKEELDLLMRSMESWLDSYYEHPEYEGHLLQNKIQSMIDNYCEHEEREIMGWVSKCVKCGVKFGDETQ